MRRRDYWQRKGLCFIKRDAAGRERYGRQGWRGSATVLTGAGWLNFYRAVASCHDTTVQSEQSQATGQVFLPLPSKLTQ